MIALFFRTKFEHTVYMIYQENGYNILLFHKGGFTLSFAIDHQVVEVQGLTIKRVHTQFFS